MHLLRPSARSRRMSALLETRNVSKAFGEFRALEDVSIA